MSKTSHSISVVIATYNEAENIAACINSAQSIATEIIIIDGHSQDDTKKIAEDLAATVYTVPNQPDDFHANKQLGIDKAKGAWILQLDADEQLTPELCTEINQLISDPNQPFSGYALPRKNWFLGRFLTKGGAYPDYVTRLFRRGKGHFPHHQIINNSITTSNVHAQIEIDGQIGYTQHALIHYGDREVERYLARFNRYTTLEADNLVKLGVKGSPIQCLNFMIAKPIYWFLKRYFRHRGYVDGFQGLIYALFSSQHYPAIYLKIWEKNKHQ